VTVLYVRWRCDTPGCGNEGNSDTTIYPPKGWEIEPLLSEAHCPHCVGVAFLRAMISG
jgi:hypothetical protein